MLVFPCFIYFKGNCGNIKTYVQLTSKLAYMYQIRKISIWFHYFDKFNGKWRMECLKRNSYAGKKRKKRCNMIKKPCKFFILISLIIIVFLKKKKLKHKLNWFLFNWLLWLQIHFFTTSRRNPHITIKTNGI